MTRRTELRRGAIRVLAVVGAAVAALGVAPARGAQAHDLGHDAVDGCEIRNEDETSYDVERSTATIAWESLSGGSCVQILGDTWDAVADLEWKDAYRSDVGWAGLYEYEPGADDIHLNGYYLNTYDQCKRNNVAMHELGHAHGIGHSPGTVMNSFAIGICTLTPHDIADYESLWGPSNPPPPPPTTLCPECQEP